MRSRNSKIARTIASVLMSLLFLTAVSPAATKPISAPEGLARDSKGNLYIANYSGNEILIYSPSYQQMKSITKSISGPTGIAFDPSGNFYVTNINANTITEYSPTGAYLSDIADVPTPDAISIDGVGNMCVQLADSAIILFSPSLNSEMQIAQCQRFAGQLLSRGRNPRIAVGDRNRSGLLIVSNRLFYFDGVDLPEPSSELERKRSGI